MKKAELLRGIWHLKAPHQETVSYFIKAERFAIKPEETRLDGRHLPDDFFWSFTVYVFLSYGFDSEHAHAVYLEHEEKWRSTSDEISLWIKEYHHIPEEPFEKIVSAFEKLLNFQLPFAGDNASLWRDYPSYLLSKSHQREREISHLTIDRIESFLTIAELGIEACWIDIEEWEKRVEPAKRLSILL